MGDDNTYSLIVISGLFCVIQYFAGIVFDIIFIKSLFYGYISSSSIDMKFFNIILVIGYIKFQLAPIFWVSFYKVIGVIFKVSATEACLNREGLLILQDVFLSLYHNHATISSEQHLHDLYSIHFQNLNLKLEDFEKILFIFCKEPIIFQILIDLIQYRLDSSYLFGFEFTAEAFSASEPNAFKCLIEYI